MRACWLVKLGFANRIDSDHEMPDWVQRHLEQCEPCRSSCRAEARMAEALGEESRWVGGELPPFLHGKIMSAVRHAKASPGPRLTVRSSWWSLAIAVSAMILVVFSARFLPVFHKTPDTGALVSQTVVDSNESLAPVLSLANREKLMAFSRNLDEPLQAELQFVVSDAKTAIQSLARSFIPEQMIAQSGW